MEEVYTAVEVAKMLKVQPNAIRDALKAGEIKAFKVGNRWRVTREALDAYMGKDKEEEE